MASNVPPGTMASNVPPETMASNVPPGTMASNVPPGTMASKPKSVRSSRSSRRSITSLIGSEATSEILIKQKLKAGVARKRLEYLAKENQLMLQKTMLEGTIKLNKAEEETEIAEYSVKLLEEEITSENVTVDYEGEGDWINSHTKHYVSNQNIRLSEEQEQNETIPKCVTPAHHEPLTSDYPRSFPPQPYENIRLSEEQEQNETIPKNVTPAHHEPLTTDYPRSFPPKPYEYREQITKSVTPAHHEPLTYTYPSRPYVAPTRDFNGTLLNFMTKKSFILERLKTFSGNSETYIGWKSTFKEVICEIDASESEEMDILIHNLKGEPCHQINSIKNSNPSDRIGALRKAWDRLDSYYGSPDRIAMSLKLKLKNILTSFNSNDKLSFYKLSDTCNEINSIKMEPKYGATLSYFDSTEGVNPIVTKLPPYLRNRWRDKAVQYKKNFNVAYPPFRFFCEFIQDTASIINDPGFDFDSPRPQRQPISSFTAPRPDKQYNRQVTANKTTVEDDTKKTRCIYHNSGHPTSECKMFRTMTINERRDMLRKHGQCFKCCDGKHLVADCQVHVKCDNCSSKLHCTGMHGEYPKKLTQGHGGEKSDYTAPKQAVDNPEPPITRLRNACTEVCDGFSGKSCAKIILVSIHHEQSQHPPVNVYAVIDDQSNKSLATAELFDLFDPDSTYERYSLSTCSGQVTTEGRKSLGFVVKSLDGEVTLDLPVIIECDSIPNNRQEIPTPEVAANFKHLSDISHLIHKDPDAPISLLIGRDMLPAHYISTQKIGQPNEPFAQKLPLGWVIIGEACIDGYHRPKSYNVLKTLLATEPNHHIQPAVMDSCTYNIKIANEDVIFKRTRDDNKTAMSIEDKEFMSVMEKEMVKQSDGHWIAPLPFKKGRPRLPNNRTQALDRARSLDNSLLRNPVKRDHFTTFMQGLFDAGHAEPAPKLDLMEECWYLPLFGVYHPQKKDRIRGVFDSSAKYNGISLNNVLMTGPDLMNNLTGVLMRFRKETVAVMADIEQMFYNFRVHPDHRRYLRFIWHEDNNVEKPLVDFQMKVHVFGNSPSPAVATYGLRKTAEEAGNEYGSDIKDYVKRNFYVDDALSSHPTPEEANDLLLRTKSALQKYGSLRLHKISSNSDAVLSAFDNQDLAKDIRSIELGKDNLPVQRSLGVCWDLQQDNFTFNVSMEDKPFTRRGLLSSINSLFDPLGFVAPVTIAGKAILREAMTSGADWDEPLSPDFLQKWFTWKSSLKGLENLRIPRTYGGISISQADTKDLLIFSDASEMAIAAVAYLRLTSTAGEQRLGFIMGKAKLAPKHGHTIPRLELCAAVLATELLDVINTELEVKFDSIRFFTDSKVVIGYIQNETKRFFTYVKNRVDRIRRSSKPNDWNYIPTKLNPADEGTRSVLVKNIQESLWLNGPPQMVDINDDDPIFNLDDSTDLVVTSHKTEVLTSSAPGLGSHRFERFSDWYRLSRALLRIRNVVLKVHDMKKQTNCDENNKATAPFTLRETEMFIVSVVQKESFQDEIKALSNNKPVSCTSTIYNLDPFLDNSGLLRVGGRLRRSELTLQEKNPLIIPRKSHIAKLLITHFHHKVEHQGRLLTVGAIRSAGYWIIGCRRLVNTHIQQCVLCQKLRGKQQQPKMADLAEAHLHPAPPFTYIGVDVFGPWAIVTRSTRGVHTKAKRWAVIFTCLVIRAVHIELIEEMSASSFINALRRFTALRGEVRLIHSDCGTNFVGATTEMNIHVIDINDSNLQGFMLKRGIQWKFNPPHASHMGGSWERLIGVSRRILDSLLADPKVSRLTHEVLVTLMAEVCCIINARPLTEVSSDPESPSILTPATLLTLKTTHMVDSFKIEEFTPKDLYKNQWRCVQHLSNCFWKKWKSEYLSTLQQRNKWQSDGRNLQEGDIVLIRDKTHSRNDWPMGIIHKTFASDDTHVRKIEIRVGTERVFTRPATEVVLLVPKEQ